MDVLIFSCGQLLPRAPDQRGVAAEKEPAKNLVNLFIVFPKGLGQNADRTVRSQNCPEGERQCSQTGTLAPQPIFEEGESSKLELSGILRIVAVVALTAILIYRVALRVTRATLASWWRWRWRWRRGMLARRCHGIADQHQRRRMGGSARQIGGHNHHGRHYEEHTHITHGNLLLMRNILFARLRVHTNERIGSFCCLTRISRTSDGVNRSQPRPPWWHSSVRAAPAFMLVSRISTATVIPAIHASSIAFAGMYKLKSAKLCSPIVDRAPTHATAK